MSDPGLWSRPDLPELVDGLRRESPVHRTETETDGPVWSVLTYELSAQVLRDTTVYSSEGGSLLGTGPARPAGSGRMMALCDPPRHRALRAPAVPFFSPQGVRGAARGIDELADAIVRQAVERREVDLVQMVSALPLEVMCDLLDVPGQDREMVRNVCDLAFLGRAPEERRAGHQRLIPYLMHQVMRRRADPGDDLISAVAHHRVGGRLLPVEDVVLNLDNIVVGGVQTVRHTAATALLALVERPVLWQRLVDGTAETGAAVDELLRWTSVGLHTLRTVTRNTELGGFRFAAGDRVVPWLWAANRDPAVYERPHEIEFGRSPNRHLALGLGAHYCIGAPLAKAELGALFSAVLERTERIERVGPPRYNGSLINFGLDSCPVRLTPRRPTPRRRNFRRPA
nr:cytochrome P450 [Streptomyces taklimakanensis]